MTTGIADLQSPGIRTDHYSADLYFRHQRPMRVSAVTAASNWKWQLKTPCASRVVRISDGSCCHMRRSFTTGSPGGMNHGHIAAHLGVEMKAPRPGYYGCQPPPSA